MANKSYGGLVWTGEDKPPEHDWRYQTAALGAVAGAGLLAGSALMHEGRGGGRLLDVVATGARTYGNLMPFQLGNTFRIPEYLSPFTSANYQGLTSSGDMWRKSWDASYFSDATSGSGISSTFRHLKAITGRDDAWLAARGITPKMAGPAGSASSLMFERGRNKSHGSLYSIAGGKRHRLSDNIMLMQFTGESPDLTALMDKTTPVNRATYSTFQAHDIIGPGFDIEGAWKRKVEKGAVGDAARARPKWIPIAGMRNMADTPGLSSSYLRAFGAGSMERFNRLIGGLSEQVLGKGAGDFFERIGMGTAGVKSGPGLPMWLRFGAKAAAVGAAGYVGIGETDWLKRNFGIGMDIGVSAGISGGLMWLGKKSKLLSGKQQLAVGGLSFLGQMVLPGFEQGNVSGISTTWAKANVMRANMFNPFNSYRRTVEGFLPGITDWKTGALIGFGAMVASYGENPFTGRTMAHDITRKLGAKTFGLRNTAAGPTAPIKSVRQAFWDRLLSEAPKAVKNSPEFSGVQAAYNEAGGYLSWGRREQLRQLYRKSDSFKWHDWNKFRNTQWSEAEEVTKLRASMDSPKSPLNQSLVETLEDIGARYTDVKAPWYTKVAMQSEGIAAQWKHAFAGADLSQGATAKAIKGAGFRAPLGRLGLVFGATALGHQIVTGGLFGSMESADELRDIYSGKQLVSVGKSRYWEAGGTPFGGSQTDYYRPHWYALQQSRVRETGIWGEDEDRYSPVMKFFLKNFTYSLEKQNYYDRPYPISGTAFSDVPIIGGLLATTIGRVIKPPKLMHVNEWMREGDGGLEYADMFQGSRREPAYGLGAVGHGVPTSPFASKQIAAFANYQFRELEGMTGWAKNVVSNLIVGEDSYATNQSQLAEAGMMSSYRMRFWEMSTGGAGFMNEAIRRILPNYRGEIERLNPIMNNMPTWLPEKFRHGDPYRSVEWGEARMPGPGYAAIHPEMKGIDPQDYPLIYQYDILANVAPFSKEYRVARDRMYQMREAGHTSESANAWMDRIDQMARDQWNVYNMDPVDPHATQLPGSSITQAAYLTGLGMMREAVAPAEYMVPMGFRPMQKLTGHLRGPEERYEFERMYGTPYAFWDKPVRDWFRPAIYTAAHAMGYDSKPWWRMEADKNAEYFDQLEFVKWMQLAEQAEARGDTSAKTSAEYMASSTRHGVNPNGNPMSIYWSLPAEDRAFFNTFAYAKGRERRRITQMIPADQVHLYQSIWKRMDQGDPNLFAGTHTGPDAQYLYGQYSGMQMGPMPAEDWIGWHEDIDMDDIRVRYVNELGRDLHDYGLWESQLKGSMAQPYLEGSTDYLHSGGGLGMRGQITSDLRRLSGNQFARPQYVVNSNGFATSSVAVQYDDHRDGDIFDAVQGYINGY